MSYRNTCTPPELLRPRPADVDLYDHGMPTAYTSDNLVITINRGWVVASTGPCVVGTVVTVTYPYHWRFNSVIQLLIPGASTRR